LKQSEKGCLTGQTHTFTLIVFWKYKNTNICLFYNCLFVYWIGILISSVIFALGHFPIAFQAVSNPSGLLLNYILHGNSIGRVIFGWLYWKKGLETAFIAHIFTHIIMILGEPLINIA